MMHRSFPLLLLLLTACQGILDTADRTNTGLRANYIRTSNFISDGFRVEDKKVKHTVFPRTPTYCYRTFTDVLCYPQPLPGAESRLVGYQEPVAQTWPDQPQAVVYPAPTPVERRNLMPMDSTISDGPRDTMSMRGY